MFPFFHFAVPLLFILLIEYFNEFKDKRNENDKVNNIQTNKFAILIGAMLPDLVDKPLALVFNLSGRGVGHFLITILLFALIMGLVFKSKKIGLSLFIGMFFHLVLDIPYVPWFGPFVYYEFAQINMHDNLIEFWIYNLFHEPLVYITEFSGLIILLGIFMGKKLYRTKNLKDFLF